LPKPVRFKADSVVYFQGDVDERIYILKSGRIVLRSKDIETGQEISDLIQTGEFFGVKSALGKFPREEDAVVLSDADVVQFSVSEFEQIVSSNTRIIIKMLKVFSNQLRRIHSKVSSMLNQQDQIDPAEGLHHSASFYFKNKQFAHASYIWKRYLELYPDGRHAAEAKQQLARAEQSDSAQSHRSAEREASAPVSMEREELSQVGQVFFEAESAFANDNFADAIKGFRNVLESADDGEYKFKAQVQLGRCYFESGDLGQTIRHFSQLLKDIPRHPQMPEILFYIGSSYLKNGDAQKGAAFLKKARAGANDEPALRRKIDKALSQVGN
jgi:CRP-like cAMP-binding protein